MTTAAKKPATCQRRATASEPIAAVTMRRALADKNLLGRAFAPSLLRGDSWLVWRALLVAANGEELTDAERVVFEKLTGREREPLARADEFIVIAGRRSGKSRAIGVLLSYLAGLVDYSDVLVPGERAVALCISPTVGQSDIVFQYTLSTLEESPSLKRLIKAKTRDCITLTNGVDIVIRPANVRGVRGSTCIACVADEASFLFSDDSGSANPDVAIIDAVRPSLRTTNGILVMISSPYARRGVVYDAWQKNYGPDGDKAILVARGATKDFNPTYPQRKIDQAYARMPSPLRQNSAANGARILKHSCP
jgi:hypothetical protein